MQTISCQVSQLGSMLQNPLHHSEDTLLSSWPAPACERALLRTDRWEHWQRRQPCLCINYVKGRIPR